MIMEGLEAMPYTPILNNDYLLAAFLAFIPGHFAVAEKLWTSWFKNYSPLVVHFWVKLFVIMLAITSVKGKQLDFVLLKELPLKMIFGLIVGFLFFMIEYQISHKKEKINSSFESIYEERKNKLFLTLLVLNVVCEEFIFRKYLTEFILTFRHHFLIFYSLVFVSTTIFGLVHINFGLEKCLIKSVFAMILLATVVFFNDITAAIIAHMLMNILGLYYGKLIRLRYANA